MAFTKSLAHRLLAAAKSCSSQLRGGSSPATPTLLRRLLPDSGHLHRRFLHRDPPISHPSIPPDRCLIDLPSGDNLLNRIRSLTPSGNRLRLDSITSPSISSSSPSLRSLDSEKVSGEKKIVRSEDIGGEKMIRPEEIGEVKSRITVDGAKKVFRAAQMQAARKRLGETARRSGCNSSISYVEFVKVCRDVAGHEHGDGIAHALDESGAVIVLGDVVFLHPEQVVKAVESMLPLFSSSQYDSRQKELKEMEAKKAMIDKKAETGVRRELWTGLGFLVVQTAAFMRLTFWELSWDVMEPICFYVTSFYFMAGYAFFLCTSRDPSFEGFFASRFATKQKKLMKSNGFDICRFNKLQGVCPDPDFKSVSPPKDYSCSPSYCNCSIGSSLMRPAH